MAEKTRPPYPGQMIGRIPGDDDNTMAAVIGEVIAITIMPEGFLGGKTGRLKPSGEIGDAGVIGPTCNRAIAQRDVGAEDCEHR